MDRIAVSGDRFLELLNTRDIVSNFIVEDDVSIYAQEIWRNRNCFVHDCEFNQFSIFNGNLNISLSFSRCKFNQDFKIESITCNSETAESFTFDSSFFHKEVIIRNCILGRGIKFFNCSSFDAIKIINLQINQGYFILKECKLNGEFSIINTDIKSGYFSLVENSFEKKVILESIVAGLDINILNSKFCKELDFFRSKAASICFVQCECNDSVSFVDVFAHPSNDLNDGVISIQNTIFKKSMGLLPVNVSATEFLSRLLVSSSKFQGGFCCTGWHIGSLEVDCSNELEGVILFDHTNFDSVYLRQRNFRGDLVFRQCTFTNLRFTDFYNSGNVSFSIGSSSSRQSVFSVVNSNLGKVQFQNFNLESFSECNIENSMISEVEFSNMTWFNPKALKTGRIETWETRRDVYRQLKKACEKHNDRINALLFQGREMEEYSKAKLSWNDRAILWFSRTNDFGQNWLKPVLQVFLLTILFFVFIALAASPRLSSDFAGSYEDLVFSWRELLDVSTVFPQLFNPARSLKDIFPADADLSFGVYVLDGLQRIVLTFYIAQVVSAFRKYFK